MAYLPIASSPEFPQQVSELTDKLDELIESMIAKLAITTGKTTTQVRTEVDQIEVTSRHPRRPKRRSRKGSHPEPQASK